MVFCYNTLNGLKYSDFSLLRVALSWVHRPHILWINRPNLDLIGFLHNHRYFILCIILRRGPRSSSNCKKKIHGPKRFKCFKWTPLQCLCPPILHTAARYFLEYKYHLSSSLKSLNGPNSSRIKSKLNCMTINYVHNWLLLISSVSHTLQLKYQVVSAILWILKAFSLLSAFAQLFLLSFTPSLSTISSEKPSWPSSTPCLNRMPCQCSHHFVMIPQSTFLMVFGQFIIGLYPLLNYKLFLGQKPEHSKSCKTHSKTAQQMLTEQEFGLGK